MLNIKASLPLKGHDGKKRNFILEIIATFAIYSLIFPLIFADISAQIYQAIYFPVYNVPKIKRSDYVRIERYKLHKLNLLQKIACVYCEYANGIVAWLKVLVNQTETYTCAIKQGGPVKGQEHREGFHPYEEFI